MNKSLYNHSQCSLYHVFNTTIYEIWSYKYKYSKIFRLFS